jgi:hypothetical protein
MPYVSSPGEPSVQALTAEIRVLQVGSKSLAISAARQLDYADATAITPFGRVRIDPKPADGLIEVIGSVNGILVRSSASARKVRCPGWASAPGTRDYLPRGYGLPQLVCRQHYRTGPETPAGHHDWTEYTPSQKIYEAWQALPLIVLAGLR